MHDPPHSLSRKIPSDFPEHEKLLFLSLCGCYTEVDGHQRTINDRRHAGLTTQSCLGELSGQDREDK